jgi:hypothetical protein
MCKLGTRCECAKTTSRFHSSLNVIGGTDGLLGADALMESRTQELNEYVGLLESDASSISGKRRSLVQLSQCPGIGKTTLLCLMANKFTGLLAKSGQATGIEMIGSLVSYNGGTSKVLHDIPMEAALCIRTIYGALACHSATGRKCDNLVNFNDMAKQIGKADLTCQIDVPNTRQMLWRWFGQRPIFIGIDEALKCQDGLEREKLQSLMTAAGAFLDGVWRRRRSKSCAPRRNCSLPQDTHECHTCFKSGY